VTADAPIRVAFDHRPALTLGEGVGRYARELARALDARGDVALRLFGATWAPATFADEAEALERARLFRVRVPSKPLLGAMGALGLGVERLFRGGADLAHHTQYRRLPTRLPEVATVHDLVYLDSERHVSGAVARRMSGHAREVARTARAIVTPSATVADEVAARLGVPRERVVPTLLGADHVLRVPPGRSSHRGVDLLTPFVFTLARIEPRKNHAAVLRALERLGADAPRWLVAGPMGDGAEDFVRAVERSPLRERVELLGRVADSDARALVEHCAAFVIVPHDEGFGLAPAEAMALGAPVITSDVPVVREVCGDGARLVAPDDDAALAEALAGVLGDAPARERLRAAGRLRAAELTWTRTAAATREAYALALA